MFVVVKAENRPHAGTFTPGRFWPNGVSHRIEIVDDEIAAKQLLAEKGKKAIDEAALRLAIASGPFLADGKPDPDRITRSGLAAIKANDRLSVLGDGETQGTVTQAAVDAARAEIARTNKELTDSKIWAAELEATVEKLEKENADLLKEKKDLSARVAALEAAVAKTNTKDTKDSKGDK